MKSKSYLQPSPDGESLMLVFPRHEQEQDPPTPPTDWKQVEKDPAAYISKRMEQERQRQRAANLRATTTSPATGRSSKKATTTKTSLSSNEPPA